MYGTEDVILLLVVSTSTKYYRDDCKSEDRLTCSSQHNHHPVCFAGSDRSFILELLSDRLSFFVDRLSQLHNAPAQLDFLPDP
jgi:hypothetical protein